MSVRRPRPRRASKGGREARGSLRSELLQHGHAWVAAIASLVGVLVTVAIAAGVFERAEPTPSGGIVAPQEPAASAGPGGEPDASPGARSSAPAPSATAMAGVGGDVTSAAQLAPMLEAFGLPARAPYADYATVASDAHGIAVEVPAEWSDAFAGNWLDNRLDENVVLGSVALATPSERTFYSGWTTEGLFFAASTRFPGLNGEQLLDQNGQVSHLHCAWAGGGAFASETYLGGRYDLYRDCEGGEMVVVDIGAPSRTGDHAAFLHFRLTSTADVAALVRAIETFRFAPPPEASPVP